MNIVRPERLCRPNKRKRIVTLECLPINSKNTNNNNNNNHDHNEDNDEDETELRERIQRLHYNNQEQLLLVDVNGKLLFKDQSSSSRRKDIVVTVREKSFLGQILQFVYPYILVDTIHFLPFGLLINLFSLMIVLEVFSSLEDEQQFDYDKL